MHLKGPYQRFRKEPKHTLAERHTKSQMYVKKSSKTFFTHK